MKKLFFIGAIGWLYSYQPATNPAPATHAKHMASPTAEDYADKVNQGLITRDTLKGSPHRTAMKMIGGNHVHIEYSSPGVRGRVIWGGLVPYDEVWAAGAHQATWVQFSRAVIIDKVTVPSGQYGLFAIPGKEQWILILNKNWDQHLTDEYDPSQDIVRIKVTPEAHGETQRLTYLVESAEGSSGFIRLRWEKLQLSLPFKNLDK